MLEFIPRRIRLFLKSELDLSKDRLLAELRRNGSAYLVSEKPDFERRLAAIAHTKGFTIEHVRREFIIDGFRDLNSLIMTVGE